METDDLNGNVCVLVHTRCLNGLGFFGVAAFIPLSIACSAHFVANITQKADAPHLSITPAFMISMTNAFASFTFAGCSLFLVGPVCSQSVPYTCWCNLAGCQTKTFSFFWAILQFMFASFKLDAGYVMLVGLGRSSTLVFGQ